MNVEGDNVGYNTVCIDLSQMLSPLVLTRNLSEINKSSHSYFTDEVTGGLKGYMASQNITQPVTKLDSKHIF